MNNAKPVNVKTLTAEQLSIATPKALPKTTSKYAGFTLIETIVGLVVLALSFTVISQLMFPAVTRHADQLHQIRAAELGQSMLNEILTRAFDENSDHVDGSARCGDASAGAPNCSTSLGVDSSASETSSNREDWNDVDDYNGFAIAGSDIDASYQAYEVAVTVCWDPNYDGSCDASSVKHVAKRIEVKVITPLGQDIIFASYRGNF